MKKLVTIILLLIFNPLFSSIVHAERSGDFAELKLLRQILGQDDSQLDLARIKLTIDKLIDPSINIDQELSRINQIVEEIKTMLPSNASAMDKMLEIKKYIYTPGVWNVSAHKTTPIF